MTGEMKRDTNSDLVAIKTIFGWCLSGPFQDKTNYHESNVGLISSSHIMRISCENNDENVLNKLHKFWDLDSIGIKENESSVYEKFEEEIEFIDNRYVVKLPVKENHPPLPDNYLLSKKRLEHLKSKLEKDESLLKRYDVIQEQLKMSIIEEINTPGVPNNVTYLPHRAVIKENRATTKLRIVFDASAKSNKDNVSLN